MLPVLYPDNIVVGDNLNYHFKGESGEVAAEMIHRVPAYYIRLPTYSPELNPSEKVFGFLKGQLRHCSIHDNLIQAITNILSKITYEHMLGWYKKCGWL